MKQQNNNPQRFNGFNLVKNSGMWGFVGPLSCIVKVHNQSMLESVAQLVNPFAYRMIQCIVGVRGALLTNIMTLATIATMNLVHLVLSYLLDWVSGTNTTAFQELPEICWTPSVTPIDSQKRTNDHLYFLYQRIVGANAFYTATDWACSAVGHLALEYLEPYYLLDSAFVIIVMAARTTILRVGW
jgi:hypothetical protein